MIDEAMVDCYRESERVGGWFGMIEQSMTVPFETKVLGPPVTVERVDLDSCDQIVAICSHGVARQTRAARVS